MKPTVTRPGLSSVVSSGKDLESGHKIVVLLVDDQDMVGQAVQGMLEDESDITFHFCNDPATALQVAEEVEPTVILQDLVMPKVDGLTMVKFFRANPKTKDVPMIVLSSREEADIKSEAFALGANDYMVKFPDKLEVLARVRYHSSAYINLLERNQAFEALSASQELLKSELDEAERYVISLLPDRIDSEEMKTDWVFTSSTDLGGDSFGYHWLDDDHFVVFLLDVCGHGVGAALLSVSAMNVLRAQSLPGVDFKDPAAVLSGLNETFDMDKQNQMYFTMWYGVYNKNTKELNYSAGGHPPSILIKEDGTILQLHTPGMVIGGMPGVSFEAKKEVIGSGDCLYVFSDGVYEIDYAPESGKEDMMSVEDFADLLKLPAPSDDTKVNDMVKLCQKAQGRPDFEDDYSLVQICFK